MEQLNANPNRPLVFRSGFVGIIGRPNVGKSTMLNFYLKQKLAIVSPKPQTTRHRILGVLTRPDAQVLFLDSPGLQAPEHPLGRHMLEVAKAVLDEADVLVVLIDARAGITAADEEVFTRVQQAMAHPRPGQVAQRALLAINKIDLVKKPRLLPLLQAVAQRKLFTDAVPVSALTGQQMDVLLEQVIAHLPEGPRWYEPGQLTDQTQAQQISERIREQLLLLTHQEVPYAVTVRVDQLEERETVTTIQATILVERPGQKAIIIGHGGQQLKRIGQAARGELERLLGRKVHLGLWVKVEAGWRQDEERLRELGYTT